MKISAGKPARTPSPFDEVRPLSSQWRYKNHQVMKISSGDENLGMETGTVAESLRRSQTTLAEVALQKIIR